MANAPPITLSFQNVLSTDEYIVLERVQTETSSLGPPSSDGIKRSRAKVQVSFLEHHS